MWLRLFPDTLAAHHDLIAHKLQQAIAADISLGPDLNELLANDWQWVTLRLSTHPVMLQSVSDVPLSQHDQAANALRLELKKRKQLGHYYLVDCVLAELQHGQTLNGELFAIFKKLTLLCAISLTRLNLAEQVADDGSVDAALRNVRMAADQRRGQLLDFLSRIDIKAPLETLIDAIEELRPEFATNKTLTGQVGNLLGMLERLAEQRIKRQRSGGGTHRPTEKQRLEFSPLNQPDDGFRLTRLTAVNSHQGRRRLSDEELETARDQIADQETWLIELCTPRPEGETCFGAEPNRPQLMDWQARGQQSRSAGLAMSLRGQMLPCDPGCAIKDHITTLVRALCRPTRKNPAQLALLAMLVLGMDWSAFTALRLWTRGPRRFPGQGSSFRGADEQYNGNGIWCHHDLFALQRWHQVANSRVHKGLDPLLPAVHFYLLLPLPQVLLQLVDGERLLPCSHTAIAQELHAICQRYRLTLTVAQLSRYQSQWLKRSQVDEAISAVLRGKTAQQCAPLAYSHLDSARVLTVWLDYLQQLGLETAPIGQAMSGAIGSRLFPNPAGIRTLLAHYQRYLTQPEVVMLRRRHDPRYHNLLVRHTLLILNLATGARPVSDMYDERRSYDLLMGMIRIVDKEGRDCSAARLVPLAPQAIEQLRQLEQHLEHLSKRHDPALCSAAFAARQALASERPLLFWLTRDETQPSGPLWQVQPITVTSMQDHFDNLLPLPANWHRHAVRSALLARQVAPYLINALLGHEEMGQEFGHPCSGADLNSLRTLAPILGDWLDELGLAPLAGWTSA